VHKNVIERARPHIRSKCFPLILLKIANYNYLKDFKTQDVCEDKAVCENLRGRVPRVVGTCQPFYAHYPCVYHAIHGIHWGTCSRLLKLAVKFSAGPRMAKSPGPGPARLLLPGPEAHHEDSQCSP
jgi:hypothetical protein